jgi:hypothetical protein
VNPVLNICVIIVNVQEEAQQLERDAQELRAAQDAFSARRAAVEADLSAREAAVAAAQGGHAQVHCNWTPSGRAPSCRRAFVVMWR